MYFINNELTAFHVLNDRIVILNALKPDLHVGFSPTQCRNIIAHNQRFKGRAGSGVT